MTTFTARTVPTTTFTGREQIRQPDSYILTELSEILTTESGLSLIFEYGPLGTILTGRVIPT